MAFELTGPSRQILGSLIVASVLAGCEDPNTYVEPPPPKVTIAQPLVQDVVDALEFTGTTESSARVEVRARVSGILENMHFEPGTTVEQGDLLFVIDREVYEAAAEAARADLTQAEAASELADVTLARMREAGAAVSKTQVDEAAAAARQAAAEIQLRQAELRQAEIDLGYTEVGAPITGRVGRNLVDVGNLVGEGEATVLTDITAFDPMYVYFNINERDLLRVTALARERVGTTELEPDEEAFEEANIALQLRLANEEGFPHEGVLNFADSRVDPDTGTLQLRGSFANQGNPPELLPGLFARVRLPIATRPDMPLVTERAIGADQSGQFVLIVDEQEGLVEKRNVELGQLVDGMRVIEDGLVEDEWVVVNGLQRARPGAKVDPEIADMAAFTASALRAAADRNEGAAPDEGTADEGAADGGEPAAGGAADDAGAEPAAAADEAEAAAAEPPE